MGNVRHNDSLKDSGAEWIGLIPQEWRISKIGSLYTLRNQKVSDKDYPPLSVTMNGVVPQLATAAKTDDGDNRKLVRVGDFAINSRSDRRGSCGISQHDGSVSLINTILTPRGKMHPGYYNWLFHTTSFADEFYKWGHGIVDDLWTTHWQEMKRILVPVPPYEIQNQIALFLEEYCSKIDSVISEAKASIEEYKSWKASIIYEAVTKGLDPDVEMKDSGVDIIGSMPASWKLCRLKYLCDIMTGNQDTQDADENGIYPFYVRSPNIQRSNKYTFEGEGVLMAGDGAGAGRVFHHAFGKYAIHQRVYCLHNFKNINVEYFLYFISELFKKVMDKGSAQSTVPSIRLPMIQDFLFCIPSEGKQGQIVKLLNNRCASINSIISEKEALVSDLESYKKSLIFEVVTGKRRVV